MMFDGAGVNAVLLVMTALGAVLMGESFGKRQLPLCIAYMVHCLIS